MGPAFWLRRVIAFHRWLTISMYVLLFDIDGTLIDTGGAGGRALLTAFSDLFDVEKPGPVAFSGRTDRGIVRDLFGKHGIQDSEENWCRLRDEYLQRLSHYLPRRQGRVLQGVQQLLTDLARRDDVTLGLLTGNVRDGARIKLEYFQLYHYFGFGGFGDDHPDRDDVARVAWQESCRHLQRDLEAARVWVIGDTPFDITCARAINARVLAVATGTHPRAELAKLEPDILLDSLEETDVFAEMLA
jgi:phosphoglycolate phosphatase